MWPTAWSRRACRACPGPAAAGCSARAADQLAPRGRTVQDVEGRVAARSVEIPAGRIESTRREFSVRSLGELKTPREFGEMVVTSQGGQIVKLKDGARGE